jgi:hypothetical protein
MKEVPMYLYIIIIMRVILWTLDMYWCHDINIFTEVKIHFWQRKWCVTQRRNVEHFLEMWGAEIAQSKSNYGRPARSPVTTMTELPRMSTSTQYAIQKNRHSNARAQVEATKADIRSLNPSQRQTLQNREMICGIPWKNTATGTNLT